MTNWWLGLHKHSMASMPLIYELVQHSGQYPAHQQWVDDEHQYMSQLPLTTSSPPIISGIAGVITSCDGSHGRR